VARVGIYSGTFDPVHKGHVSFALEALVQAGLDSVVFLPEREPREKTRVTNFSHRVKMLRLASAEHIALDMVELPDSRFSVQATLPKLQARFGSDLSLLIGSDVVRTFAFRWPGLTQLLEQVGLVVALRQEDDKREIETLLRQVEARFILIDSPANRAASSEVRSQGTGELLHPAVLDYITSQRLYWLARPTN
jgi:nicotinate-nucleotide adenylyltransferase